MNWLTNPRLGDFLIIAAFIGNAIRWSFDGNWPRAGYWASAALLNVCISLM